MKKQRQIARWLKGLCVLLAIMFTLFLGAVSVFIRKNTDWYPVIFSLFIYVFSYMVLFQFWRVCCEIEKDNSFSLENARSFHIMSIIGGFAALNYLTRVGFFFIANMENFLPLIYSGAMICLCIVFTVICECLSQLIKNAYEIKQENELTI